jgi:hypothetical protein
MNDKTVQQVCLQSGPTQRICWVDEKCNPGDVITLKNSDEPDRKWMVTHSYGTQKLMHINRGWNNNI